MAERITESELILPSLYLMYLRKSPIKTSELIRLLAGMMKPVGQDAEILANRKDTYFSQKVRNLKSHDTLQKYGYAVYADGAYSLTLKGQELVESNLESLKYLFSDAFDYKDVRKSLGKLYAADKGSVVCYDELVSEGGAVTGTSKLVQRSVKLRNAAIEHFTKDGVIKCECCGFEFRSFYGDKYGLPCIEIHHMKPIFEYAGNSLVQTVDEALKNLLPVCPNCHRVIHKNHIGADRIAEFKEYLSRLNP